jgi:CYTH domain-containing protein
VHDWHRSPGAGRYAHPELERRWIVTGTPPLDTSSMLIEDRYLDGTSLRLRRISSGGETIWKLTQKIRSDPQDPTTLSLTNMYLSSEDYDLLGALPASPLTKTRTVCEVDGARYVVDVFGGHLTGLRLAELEVEDLTAALAMPVWLGTEVTHDDRYSGGRLARATPDEVRTLLARE